MLRGARRADAGALETELYARAFSDEDLWPLVSALLCDEDHVRSFVAVAGSDIVGHIAFTRCSLVDSAATVVLLGPLAVVPFRQKQGIGTALVEHGLQYLKAGGETHVQVLGDPGYYGRFGFVPDTGLVPPYPLPEQWQEAWQSLCIADTAPPVQGRLCVPPPWRDPALWAP